MRTVVQRLVILYVFVFMSISTKAQTTNASANGLWTTGTNWIGGTSPGVNALGATSITVNTTYPNYLTVGQYGANQNISFAANNEARTLTVNGILVIYGNLTFGNKAVDLVIPSGSTVIVLGNLSMDNKIDLSNGGTLVVKGTFDKGGSQGTFTGTGGVYAGTYTGDADYFVPAGSEFDVDPDLYNNPALQYIEDFLNSNGQNNLPIELLSFEAEPGSSSIDLQWSTASEKNFNYFSLERSRNGKDFVEIAQIKGSGNSNIEMDYSFSDESPLIGKSYYRLRSVDFDNYQETFEVIAINYACARSARVFPNPAVGSKLNLGLNYTPTSKVSVVVTNLTGTVKGSFEFVDQVSSFDVQLDPGTYLVRISSEELNQVIRVVVQ